MRLKNTYKNKENYIEEIQSLLKNKKTTIWANILKIIVT